MMGASESTSTTPTMFDILCRTYVCRNSLRRRFRYKREFLTEDELTVIVKTLFPLKECPYVAQVTGSPSGCRLCQISKIFRPDPTIHSVEEIVRRVVRHAYIAQNDDEAAERYRCRRIDSDKSALAAERSARRKVNSERSADALSSRDLAVFPKRFRVGKHHRARLPSYR